MSYSELKKTKKFTPPIRLMGGLIQIICYTHGKFQGRHLTKTCVYFSSIYADDNGRRWSAFLASHEFVKLKT